MENKLKVRVARDEDGKLCICFNQPPIKGVSSWWIPKSAIRIDSDIFPSVKWEDTEPTEAYITLAEPQSEKEQAQSKQAQSKQEQKIDWEQRRYEIAKEMLPVLYQQSAEILKCGKSITWEDAVGGALNFADTLIAKLKEQSE